MRPQAWAHTPIGPCTARPSRRSERTKSYCWPSPQAGERTSRRGWGRSFPQCTSSSSGVHFSAMSKRLIAVFLLLSATLAQPQTKKPNPSLRPDAGAVTAGVYKSDYFGFEYKIPAGFTERTAAMPKDGRGITFGLLYVSEPKHETKVAKSVTLLADDATVWKSKNGAEYLDKVNAQMQSQADLVGKLVPLEFGGQKWWRQDYQPHAAF